MKKGSKLTKLVRSGVRLISKAPRIFRDPKKYNRKQKHKEVYNGN